MKEEVEKLFQLLSNEKFHSKLEKDEHVAFDQARELIHHGRKYVNTDAVSISLRIKHSEEIKVELGQFQKKSVDESYIVKIFKDNFFFHFDTWIYVNGYGNRNFTFTFDVKKKVNELSYYSKEMGKLQKEDDYRKYFNKMFLALESPLIERWTWTSKYIVPYYHLSISPLKNGLIPKTKKKRGTYKMVFYPEIVAEGLSFKSFMIPDLYLANKPRKFMQQLGYDAFVQVMQDAAENDDTGAICSMWQSLIRYNCYDLKKNQFPGILIASCEIIDVIGDNGSEWYNVGIIITKTARSAVLIVDGFGGKYDEHLLSVDTNQKLELVEILEEFRKHWKYRVNEVGGLKPNEVIVVDMRKKIFKELLN